MFKNAWFHGRDAIATPPVEAVIDCTQQGSNDEAVAYWVDKLDFNGPAWLIREHLQGYGAWEPCHLCNHTENLQRLFWLWCHDIRESCDVDRLDLTQDDVDANAHLYLMR